MPGGGRRRTDAAQPAAATISPAPIAPAPQEPIPQPIQPVAPYDPAALPVTPTDPAAPAAPADQTAASPADVAPTAPADLARPAGRPDGAPRLRPIAEPDFDNAKREADHSASRFAFYDFDRTACREALRSNSNESVTDPRACESRSVVSDCPPNLAVSRRPWAAARTFFSHPTRATSR